MSTDLTFLVKKAKEGDSAAFSELYSFYCEDMFRYAVYMLKNRDDAEDCVQDAVLTAWKHIGALRDEALFKAWIFKILSNRCKAVLISQSKSPDALPDEFEPEAEDGADAFIFEKSELREALCSLTPPDGQIVLLSVIGGFKSSELARIFNLPPGTIRSKQKRALEKLRGILS